MPGAEEEKLNELYSRNKQGDLEAREELFSRNIPLVHALVRRFKIQKKVEYDDLFQEGCIGLFKALSNFNPERGVKFSSYAAPFILGEMRAFLRRSGHHLKLSRSYHEQYYHIKNCYSRLEQTLKRQPRLEEIAQEMEMSREEIAWIMELQSPPMPLSEAGLYNGENCMEMFDDKINAINIQESINSLPPRERQIIVLRYFMGKSQEDTAKALSLSQSHVSKLEKKILHKLKSDNE